MALLGEWVEAVVVATPFLAEVVALPMLLLTCHRGTGLPPLQHALAGYGFTLSSAIVDYVHIL